MAVPNWKLPLIIETSGAVVVGEESCVGDRHTRWLTETSGSTLAELMDSILERYIKIDCAIFTPNPSRTDFIKQMVASTGAGGVIHYSLQFCQPYQIESIQVEKNVEQLGIPVLRVETDYSQEDAAQLKTRLEAFIEMVKEK